MIKDFISDFVTRIRNGSIKHKESIFIPANKNTARLLDIIQSLGYIINYVETEGGYTVYLKYIENKPIIKKIVRISKPSQRVYIKKQTIAQYIKASVIGTYVLSTPQGFKVHRKAYADGVGGEVLFYIQ